MKKTIAVTLGILAGFALLIFLFRLLKSQGSDVLEYSYAAIFCSLLVVFIVTSGKK